jgi:arylsulfatase A-like enzyme
VPSSSERRRAIDRDPLALTDSVFAVGRGERDMPERPNIVCIVADDLGWRDLSCYGSPFYETPHLDRLAHEGARFTDAYASCPVCSPTRASLVTGQYPARVGITNYIAGEAEGKLREPEYTLDLPHDRTTVAEALSAAGYETAFVGKWHLGDEGHWPEDCGFDHNVAGCDWGMPGNGYFSPWGNPKLDDGPDGEYLTDRLTDEAIDLIDGADEPFFLDMSYYAVHTPIQAPADLVDTYDAKREALGLDPQPFDEGPRMPCEHKQDQRIVRRREQSDPTYAAMVHRMDANVGRLLDAIAAADRETVVLFTADNGGLATAEGSPTCNAPLAEGKGWLYEGGNRVPLICRWPGHTDGEIHDTPATSPDLFATILDAAGVDLPDQPVDGVSLRPVLAGDAIDRDAIFWHYPHYGNQGGTPAGAVRTDRYKLVEFFEDDHVELYDLAADVGERTDISDDEPALAADLRERLAAWRADVDATMPTENPDFEPWPDRAEPGQAARSDGE